jgi:hypothetical protein
MRRLSIVTALVAALAVMSGVGSGATVATHEGLPSKTTPPATTVPTTSSTVMVPPTSSSNVPASSVIAASQSTVAPNPDNDHLFTFGEIEIPPGEPDQLSVVLGQTTDAGDLMIVVRNTRDETVNGVSVAITGTDASGAETFSTIVLIATVLEPDQWAFGQADLVPRLDETANFDLSFGEMGQPGDFINIDVTDAELSDGAIVGTVMNNSDVVIANISVNVACFQESQITAYQLAMADAQVLGTGESATFGTTTPIDLATCPSFAIYAVGFPPL